MASSTADDDDGDATNETDTTKYIVNDSYQRVGVVMFSTGDSSDAAETPPDMTLVAILCSFADEPEVFIDARLAHETNWGTSETSRATWRRS